MDSFNLSQTSITDFPLQIQRYETQSLQVFQNLYHYIVLPLQLMSKVAPLVGKEMTWRLFLPQFTELCSDGLFHIRKVGTIVISHHPSSSLTHPHAPLVGNTKMAWWLVLPSYHSSPNYAQMDSSIYSR